MAVLGRAAWWLPQWLSRILPNPRGRGDRLKAHLFAREASDSTLTGEVDVPARR